LTAAAGQFLVAGYSAWLCRTRIRPSRSGAKEKPPVPSPGAPDPSPTHSPRTNFQAVQSGIEGDGWAARGRVASAAHKPRAENIFFAGVGVGNYVVLKRLERKERKNAEKDPMGLEE